MFELNSTNPNQSLTISANTASTNILNTQVIPTVFQDLQRLAADPNLNEKLKLTFGSDYNVQTAQTILENWLLGDFSTIPSIELVERGDIAGANGAFATATNKIYLSKDILTGEATNIAAVEDIIVEEIGHSIDALVNAVDAPGDEGAIFAATVQGKVSSSEELSVLKAEDDSAVVIMGGKPIVIEQNTISNPQTINNSTGYFTGRQLYSSDSVSTNNDKYYRFTIGQSAGRLSVGLKDMYGSADVSLIRDANNNGRVDSGEVLASSEGSSNKLISGNQLDNLSAGTYYLRVKGNASYGMAVNLDQAGNFASEGNPGGFSINKARNLGTLSDIAPSQDYQLSDFVGSTLGDSDDFYSFRLDKPRSLSFALRDMTGNANVYIEDGNGTVLAKSENGGSADELGSVNLADKTTYYVHVVPVGSESTNYRLVLNPGTPLRTGYYRELSSLSETQWDQQSGDNNQFEQYPLGGGGDQRGKTDDRIEQIYTDLSNTIFGSRVPMTSGYAYDQSYYSRYGTWHAGLDMGANNGATIKAAIGGTVTWTSGSGDGNIFVGINSDDGRQWVYGHLKSASGLSNGKRINAGETVGIVGAQNHLHLEVENGQAYGGTQGSMTNRGTLLGVTVSPLMAYWQWRNR